MGENESVKVVGFLRSWGTYWFFSMSRWNRFDGINFRVAAASFLQTYAPSFEEDIAGNSGTPND